MMGANYKTKIKVKRINSKQLSILIQLGYVVVLV